MDRNQVEIRLLKTDPGELLVRYQLTIKIIVRLFIRRGLISRHDQKDVIQELNRKLLERMPRIQEQYNGTSKLRTYFSVIVRNLCLEEVRKPFMVSEPDPEPYEVNNISEDPVDVFLIRQEYESLKRILLTFGEQAPRLRLIIKCRAHVKIDFDDLDGFPKNLTNEQKKEVLDVLNHSKDEYRKQQYQRLSYVIELLEGKKIPPDSLRKWYSARQDECLRLLNGDPPRSSYTSETLMFLIEKNNLYKKK